jgi:hypothetical protein
MMAELAWVESCWSSMSDEWVTSGSSRRMLFVESSAIFFCSGSHPSCAPLPAVTTMRDLSPKLATCCAWVSDVRSYQVPSSGAGAGPVMCGEELPHTAEGTASAASDCLTVGEDLNPLRVG